MPKEPTKKPKPKKDFVDFVKDASKKASLRNKFINELYKPELCGGVAISTFLVALRGGRVVPLTP
jgi:hypothetical protein